MKELNIGPLLVAKYFINKCDASAGDSITHLKIQKLLYYVQSWGLVLANSRFFNEKFQAWTHGPVLPSVYHELKKYKFNNLVTVSLSDDSIKLEPHEFDVLDQVWDSYSELSAKHLENLTHIEDPWLKARGGISAEASCTNEIDENIIISFYTEKYRIAEATH